MNKYNVINKHSKELLFSTFASQLNDKLLSYLSYLHSDEYIVIKEKISICLFFKYEIELLFSCIWDSFKLGMGFIGGGLITIGLIAYYSDSYLVSFKSIGSAPLRICYLGYIIFRTIHDNCFIDNYLTYIFEAIFEILCICIIVEINLSKDLIMTCLYVSLIIFLIRSLHILYLVFRKIYLYKKDFVSLDITGGKKL